MSAETTEKIVVIVPSRQVGVEFRRSLVRQGAILKNVYTETLLGLAERVLLEKFYDGYCLLNEQTGGEIMLEVLLSLQREGRLSYYDKISINPETAKTIYRTIIEVKLSHPNDKPVDFKAFADGKEKAEDLQEVLHKYDFLLQGRKFLDRADAFKNAIKHNGNTYNPGSVYYIPGHLKFYPLEEEWLDCLTGGNSQTLPLQDIITGLMDCKDGNTPPGKTPRKIIRGYGEINEVRQVLREIKKSGIALDECLVCTTDYNTYAEIFYNLSSEYNIPMTFSRGINITHTVPGKLTKALLRWFQSGNKAADFREMLFGGGVALGVLKKYFVDKVRDKLIEENLWVELTTLQAETKEASEATGILTDILSAGSLMNIVSDLLLSWDASRNKEKIAALKELKHNEYKKVSDEKKKQGLIKELANIIWVELFFDEFTQTEQGDHARLTRGLSWFLKNFTLPRYIDQEETDINLKNLQEINLSLDKSVQKDIIKMLGRFTASNFSDEHAHSLLAEFMQKARVAASGSRPGQLHITPYAQGIWTWRKHIVITGLDARRFPGMPSEDPILLDMERKDMLGEDIPEHLLKANLFKLNKEQMKLLIQSHEARASELIFSFSYFNPNDLKFVLPSAELLQIYRDMSGDDQLTYGDFDKSFVDTSDRMIEAGFYPENKRAFLSETDFWLAYAKKGNQQLKEKILQAYPSLKKAAEILQKKRSPDFNEYDGKIAPLKNKQGHDIFIGYKHKRGFSPSSLEILGQCPFRFLLEYILNLKTYPAREEGKNTWLNAADRGTLLHNTFEEFLQEIYSGNKSYTKAEFVGNWENFRKRIGDIASAQLTKQKIQFSPENEHLYQMQEQDILENCDVFLKLEKKFVSNHDNKIKSSKCEEEYEKVKVTLINGKTILLRGRIDRTVQFEDDQIVIIDYKTGSNKHYKGNFPNGRKIQPSLYAMAYGISSGIENNIKTGYVFVNKTEPPIEFHSMDDIRKDTLEILIYLYEIIEEGQFIVTENEKDCEYCNHITACSRWYFLDFIAGKRQNLHTEAVRAYD